VLDELEDGGNEPTSWPKLGPSSGFGHGLGWAGGRKRAEERAHQCLAVGRGGQVAGRAKVHATTDNTWRLRALLSNAGRRHTSASLAS